MDTLGSLYFFSILTADELSWSIYYYLLRHVDLHKDTDLPSADSSSIFSLFFF